jgi:hypothetical protein
LAERQGGEVQQKPIDGAVDTGRNMNTISLSTI